MLINIAICDDEPLELENSNNMLKRYMAERSELPLAAASFSSPLDLMAHIEENTKFDILLLDIYMPGMLGIEVAQELRKVGNTCQIIFLTTSRDHAIDAFSLNAAHYLVKPYTAETFFTALDKAISNLPQKADRLITLKTTEGIIRVNLDEIVYSESEGHKQRVVLSDSKQLLVRISSTDLFERLQVRESFYKCGSTYIINMDYVSEFSNKGVAFSTGSKLPIVSRKHAEFKKVYMNYCCRD